MSNDPSVRASLLAARTRIGAEAVRHPHLEATASRLREIASSHPLSLLLGVPGVGKTVLAGVLVLALNRSVSDDPSKVRAALVTAPAPHRKGFSWREFWIAVLDALHDPLPACKVDREAMADALRRGVATKIQRATEGALLRAVSAAARDRGLEWLFVDEAVALVKAEHGRLLRDQLDVLRNLADRGDFKVVLVSTPRIMASMQLSGELARRTGEVFFPRYGFGNDEFKSFCRVLTTFMGVLPEPLRLRPEPEQLHLLHAGSLGCVGHLADWFRRALARCIESDGGPLAWPHFAETVLPDVKLAQLADESRLGEERFAEASRRTFGLGVRDTATPSASVPEPAPSPPPTPAPAGRRRRRVGLPAPKRQAVA